MGAVTKLDRIGRFEITDRKQWRAWLKKNHKQAEGIWLVSWKKHTPHYVTYADTVEEALCFGWIDSISRKLDDDRRMQYFCPRKRRSVWSRPNKERIEKLIAAGSMTVAGLAKIEAAKADGSWGSLDAIDDMVMPEELKKAFTRNKLAKMHFNAFPPSSRKIAFYWIRSAKTEKTRIARIQKTIELAEKGIRPHQAK